MSLDDFTAAYTECLVWQALDYSDGDEPRPMDENYSIHDLSDEAKASIEEDCRAFYSDHAELWTRAGWTDEQAGHDFCLTRNRHGAGFWDRYYGDDVFRRTAGQVLTDAAHAYGGTDCYVEAGRLHV